MIRQIQEACKNFQYISFDIFDTLIVRTTQDPIDVFKLVDEMYLKKYKKNESIKNYVTVRIDSERIARNKKDSEVTLDEIYEIIASKYNQNIVNRYKNFEIEVEQKVCLASRNLKEFYEWCLSEGKTVFITSDMYLPKSVIERILRKNGYSGYKSLFLSSITGNTKNNGSLYDELLEKEHIKPNELIHIGDNIKSDILKAEQRGIHTFKIKKTKEKYVYNLDISNNGYLLYSFLKITNTFDDMYEKVGYGCFGPLLYGLVEWVKRECIANKHEKIFFLSRDGYIMQKVYERLKKVGDPESYYFYASRRALQVAAIHFNYDFDYVISHMFVPRYVSVRWLLEKWGLEPEKYQNTIEEMNFTLETELQGKEICHNESIKSVYLRLHKHIVENSIKEFKAFEKYLDTKNFIGNVAIVDIGWYGNMQNSLMSMLTLMNRKVKVAGYYLGVVPDSAYQSQYDMNGFLFAKGKNELLYPKFKYLSSMLELFFMAPHGSAKKYVLQKKEATVDLATFEFEGTKTYKNMQQLQRGALEFIKRYSVNEVRHYSESVYLAPLFKLFSKPDIKTAKAFGDLQIWDGMWITLAPDYPIFKWFTNPKVAIKNFINSSWKVGYLKRNLQIPLPYDRIVYKMNEIYKSIIK